MKNNTISKLFNLKGKTIIITGSAGRLGSRYSEILSEAGANMILIDINTKKNNLLEKHLRKKFKTDPLAINMDITDPVQIKKMKNTVLKKYKKIYGLINNANPYVTQHDLKFQNFPLDIWQKYVDVDLIATFLLCREFGTLMAKQKEGVIVNISSIYGIVGPDQRIYGNSKLNSQIPYSAVKGGIINMTKYLAAYWHNKNVRVNTLTPGGVEDKKYQSKEFIKKYSEKTMLGRMAKNDDYSGSILFLMSNASSYMTGANLIVDGGWTAW
jgi:NAD(P)-dependent dehydrogenase (short-subunit alcohol dehydrogenase family)